ncbi:MAG TPA: hypothetical protein PKD96_00080 [Candidatus Absconditabacterales bacterium]|nr:hypothetical protein [Candidatus Absconditabacterales bacterium]HMT26679.1 hypothetical protein [Candidatus Absconditabacterales bacterium]
MSRQKTSHPIGKVSHYFSSFFLFLILITGSVLAQEVTVVNYQILPGGSGSVVTGGSQSSQTNSVSGVMLSGYQINPISSLVSSSGSASSGQVFSGVSNQIITGLQISGAVTTGVINSPVVVASGSFVAPQISSSGVDTLVTGAPIGESKSFLEDEEFVSAISWMHRNGLTQYTNVEDYRPFELLTREQSAKMIGQLFKALKIGSGENNLCEFSDLAGSDQSLVEHIYFVCKIGVFRGAENKFFPLQTLTKAQVTAVLVRMFEGKLSSETGMPRWQLYFQKAQRIGLTKETSLFTYDKLMTRYEMALFVYRFKSIIENQGLKKNADEAIQQINSMQQADSQGSDLQSVGTYISQNNSFSTLLNGIAFLDEPEFSEALFWLKKEGFTQFSEPASFRPFDVLTREESAKFVGDFYLKSFQQTGSVQVPEECFFKDIETANSNLRNHILTVCSVGILKGKNGLFSPTKSVTKADFIAMLMRMFQGKSLDETVSPRWKNYFLEAQKMGIVSSSDLITFEQPITRYEVALLLYRLYAKSKLLNNLNSSKIEGQLISLVSGSVSTGVDGLRQAKIFIDASLLAGQDSELMYIDFFGQTVKVIKQSIEKYVNNQNYAWFGELYDIANDQKIGTLSFLVSNDVVLEGTMRFTSVTGLFYTIAKNQIDETFYYLFEKTVR